MRQVILSRNATRYGGFAIFRYDSIFSDDLSLPILKEKRKFKKNNINELLKILFFIV